MRLAIFVWTTYRFWTKVRHSKLMWVIRNEQNRKRTEKKWYSHATLLYREAEWVQTRDGEKSREKKKHTHDKQIMCWRENTMPEKLIKKTFTKRQQENNSMIQYAQQSCGVQCVLTDKRVATTLMSHNPQWSASRFILFYFPSLVCRFRIFHLKCDNYYEWFALCCSGKYIYIFYLHFLCPFSLWLRSLSHLACEIY